MTLVRKENLQMASVDVNQLNARYGAPGRIVFHRGFAGYPNVVIANKFGAAEISLLGANVLSYRPTGHSNVLFRSEKRDYNRGESIHGGIPLCWPQFGNRFSKELPQHGFARLMVFEVRGTEYTEEMTEVTLGIKDDAETRKLWPHSFDLSFKVSVSMKLNLSLSTKNTGAEPFDFSCGFHPYFLVRDVGGVTVRGLAGASYVDARHPDVGPTMLAGDFSAAGTPNHVFSLPEPKAGGPLSAIKHEFAILDGGLGRATAMVSAGNARCVVWNPGQAVKPADLAEDDWKRFICVEPVSDWPGGRTLAPGATHKLTVAIQASLDGAQ